MFLLTRIKPRFGPQKTNLLGARCGINWLEDKDFGLLYQAPAGILSGPSIPYIPLSLPHAVGHTPKWSVFDYAFRLERRTCGLAATGSHLTKPHETEGRTTDLG